MFFLDHPNYCSRANRVTKKKLSDPFEGFCIWFLSFLSFFLFLFTYFFLFLLFFSSLLKSSVEAQCGLVLNGQGGVIRRGKMLQILASIHICELEILSVSLYSPLPMFSKFLLPKLWAFDIRPKYVQSSLEHFTFHSPFALYTWFVHQQLSDTPVECKAFLTHSLVPHLAELIPDNEFEKRAPWRLIFK